MEHVLMKVRPSKASVQNGSLLGIARGVVKVTSYLATSVAVVTSSSAATLALPASDTGSVNAHCPGAVDLPSTCVTPSGRAIDADTFTADSATPEIPSSSPPATVRLGMGGAGDTPSHELPSAAHTTETAAVAAGGGLVVGTPWRPRSRISIAAAPLAAAAGATTIVGAVAEIAAAQIAAAHVEGDIQIRQRFACASVGFMIVSH
jgi:hypothetical protein